jgi:uncharacterized protein (TIGR02099 family)
MSLSSLGASARKTSRGSGGRIWRASLRIGLTLVVTAWILVLIAWLALYAFILPRLDDWRPAVEAQATRALGHPVQIGQLSVHSAGWVPTFALRDVVLRDKLGREALRLPKVSAALSVSSLLALRLRFDQLLIEDARLEVRRDVQGRWHVAGLDLASNDSAMAGDALADWCFDQREIVIRGGVLRWVDEQRAAPPLQLDDMLLVLRNRGRQHALRLDATPPAAWGERFSMRAQLQEPLLSRGGVGDWPDWKGRLFAELPRVDVASLQRHIDLPVDLQQGEAALRAWIDWGRGQPLALTLDADLRQVSVRLAQDLAPLAFNRLSGRFVAERSASGVKLALQRLAFSATDAAVWAPSELALAWRQTQSLAAAPAISHPVTGGEFSADRLDLGTLADLAERLPINAGLRRQLQQLNPEGTVQSLQAGWDGPLDAPTHYRVKAGLRGLAIAAAASPEAGGIGRPGWRGADLQINATESGGQADLSMAGGAIELPGVLEQASVDLTQLSTKLTWRIAASSAAGLDPRPRIEVNVINARFGNDDARGAFNASWHSGAGSGFGKGGRWPGVLELTGTLAEGRAGRVARYLPLGIDAPTRAWVQRAVQGGELRGVSYKVKGDLWNFPFGNRQDGEFRIAGRVQDMTLAPVPEASRSDGLAAQAVWPAFSKISGKLVFERNAMQFMETRGQLWGQELSEVRGRIRELSDHAELEIEGQALGPLSDLLRYLNSTPLVEWTGTALAQASGTGPAELKLGMNIPLVLAGETSVKASLQLLGNDLRLGPDIPLLPQVRGRIEATQKGVQWLGLRSQLAGGELQVDGASQPDGSLRLVLAGSVSADGLRRLPEVGVAARWAERLQGQAAYRAQISLRDGQTEWQLTSQLDGLGVDLPAPLGKAAASRLSLRLSSSVAGPRAESGGPVESVGAPALAERREQAAVDAVQQTPREWLQFELGALQASALLDRSQATPRLLRSALAYGRPLPEPVAGGRAVLTLPLLDLDAWRAVVAQVSLGRPGEAAQINAGSASALAWLPQAVQIKTDELLAGGRRLSGVTLDLQRLAAPGDVGWRVQGMADQVAGSVEYRGPRTAAGAGGIKARLARLSLPPAEAETVTDAVAGLLERAPSTVPALDIEIEDFELRGRKLGRLAVEAVNQVPAAPGLPGAWLLKRLQLGNPDARLTATGRWQAVPGAARRHMALDFKLEVDDGGALLERLGMGRVVTGAAGRMSGQLGWDGSPLGFDLPTLGGRLGLELARGQFLKVEPGAARLLGVLNLQALPRRLLLDFRDVFQDGFAFDKLSGDLSIAQGVATTDNLRLRGVQAVVLMSGSADIARESQDLQVVVLPELNTAGASLAYAAINPAIALGAFVGQWLLSEPLRQASAREFHVSGGWDDPKVERVERKLFDPLPALAAPPASRSARDLAEAAAVAAAASAPPANRP